jgi:hypothetical protein
VIVISEAKSLKRVVKDLREGFVKDVNDVKREGCLCK